MLNVHAISGKATTKHEACIELKQPGIRATMYILAIYTYTVTGNIAWHTLPRRETLTNAHPLRTISTNRDMNTIPGQYTLTNAHAQLHMILQDRQHLHMHSYPGQAEHCSCYPAD